MSTIPSLGHFSTDTRIRTLTKRFGVTYATVTPYPCVFEYKVGIEPTPLVLQTNRPPRSTYTFVSPTGLEPVTPSLKVRCSKPTELRRRCLSDRDRTCDLRVPNSPLSQTELHLDIMDNIFVPNFTFDFQRAKEIIAFSDLPVDAHLMIADPDNSAPKYAQAGCVSVTFHLEAAKNIGQTISDVKSNGAKVGVAVKPGTPFSLVEPFIEQIDLLLIMTVEPGFGGQSFMHEQMDKVKTARSRIELIKGGKPLIQVDGGISLETIGEAASAGANCFVAGSAVYRSADPENMVQLLRKSAEEHFKY